MVGVAYELLKSVEESSKCWEQESTILDQVTHRELCDKYICICGHTCAGMHKYKMHVCVFTDIYHLTCFIS